MMEQCVSSARHLARLVQVQVYGVDVRQKCFLEEPPRESSFCAYCHKEGCTLLNTCLYGSHEAYRWNGKYIYYCPMGMIFTASSVSAKSRSASFICALSKYFACAAYLPTINGATPISLAICALALPRIVAALLENNQTPEGIRIPKALVPYTGFEMID